MIKVGQRWWAWLTSTAARVWEVKHVERRGQYSVAQLLALHHFSTATSLTRSLFIAILSPLPCLALITFFDLKKLSPPYLGLLHDYILLPRATATCFIITLCLLQQLCTQVGPILPISTARLVALAAIIALANASIVMIFSLTVGFPVPFTFQSATPTEWILQVGGLWLSWRHLARANSQAWARILGAAKFYLCQGFLLAVYPLYYHLFTLVPDSSHVLRLFVWCMLPLFNVVARVLFHRFSRKEHGGQELTPLLIVFNADAMGALFITFCVQYNPSLNVSIGVAAYKIIEAGLVYWELRGAGRELGLLQRRLDGPEYSNLVPSNLSASRTRSSSMAVLNDAIQIISSYNLQQQAEGAIISSLSSVARLKSWCIPFGSSVLPVVSDCNKVQSSAELRSIDMEFLDHALQLLYRTELVLLTEYVEVVVPLLYCKCDSCWS